MRYLFLEKKWTAFICGCVICGLAATVTGYWLNERKNTVYEYPVENAADCTELLLKHGIAVCQPPYVVQKITLPVQENKTYEAYLRLQDSQGLPLRDHGGEAADMYIYEDASNDGALVTLIVCKGEIVAADRTLFGISPKAESLF